MLASNGRVARRWPLPALAANHVIDRSEPGEANDGVPTPANLKLAVEKFRERTNADETIGFLFDDPGHGGDEKGARKDLGVLEPSGYFEHPEERPVSVPDGFLAMT